MENIFHKKVAIVTGGSRGIGAAIVKKLANENYNVVFSYKKSVEEASNLTRLFDNVKAFRADVSDYLQVQELVEFTLKEYGRIDLLVNNAAIDFIKPFNLEKAPLVKIALADIQGKLYLLFDIHH